MRKTMFAAAAALATVACAPAANDNQAGNAAAPVPTAAAAETDYQQRLRGLSDRQRDGVFLRALRDAGIPCQEVRGSSYLGTNVGNASWTARCRDGSQWLITIGAGEVAQIMSVSDARRALQQQGRLP